MDRRTLLKTGTLGVLGLGLGGCATGSGRSGSLVFASIHAALLQDFPHRPIIDPGTVIRRP